jgi:UDP:flavonoid glycosyltransferase YjiC (YdhE family)
VSAPGKFLIVSWDGGGNAPPALNLGARLVQRGHHVRLLGWDSMAARAASACLEFVTYPSVPPWPADLAFEDAMEERLVPALIGPSTAADIVAAAADYDPDVLVIDCMMDAAFDAARTVKLPTALLVHLSYSGWTTEWPDDSRRAERARIVAEMKAVLALVPPGFDGVCPIPDNAAYVGPILDPNPPPLLDNRDAELLAKPGKPWVLVSLSTTLQGQTGALPGILEPLGTMPVRGLLTLGGAIPPTAVDVPANIAVRGYLPHDRILPYMAAVISHGGLSTISACLAAGIPMVCVPQGRDQHHNAAQVAASGVGRMVDPDAPPTELASAIERVLANDSYRQAAGRFAAVIAELGGGEAATDRVESLLGRT